MSRRYPVVHLPSAAIASDCMDHFRFRPPMLPRADSFPPAEFSDASSYNQLSPPHTSVYRSFDDFDIPQDLNRGNHWLEHGEVPPCDSYGSRYETADTSQHQTVGGCDEAFAENMYMYPGLEIGQRCRRRRRRRPQPQQTTAAHELMHLHHPEDSTQPYREPSLTDETFDPSVGPRAADFDRITVKHSAHEPARSDATSCSSYSYTSQPHPAHHSRYYQRLHSEANPYTGSVHVDAGRCDASSVQYQQQDYGQTSEPSNDPSPSQLNSESRTIPSKTDSSVTDEELPPRPKGYPKPLGPYNGLPAVQRGKYVSDRIERLFVAHSEKILFGNAEVRSSVDNRLVFSLSSKLLSARTRRTLHDAATNLPLLTITSDKLLSSNSDMFIAKAFASASSQPLLTILRPTISRGMRRTTVAYAPSRRRRGRENRSHRRSRSSPPALTITASSKSRTLRILDCYSNHVADIVRETQSLKSIATARSAYFINISPGYDYALLVAACVCLNEQFD